jgi:hypothetical protein
MNSQNEILKYCKGCKCEMLLKFYKINRKGEYKKTCINCLERAKNRRVKAKIQNTRNKIGHPKISMLNSDIEFIKYLKDIKI